MMLRRIARISLLAALALFSTAALAQNSEQEAGDTSAIDRDVGPLKTRIPPVSGHFFLHKGRFELTPSVGLTFNDAFFSKYVLGGALTFYPAETVGIVLHAGYVIPTVSGAAQICTTGTNSISGQAGCAPPSLDYLTGRAGGKISLLGGLDVQWAPIYGKIAVLAESFLHFDLYTVLGPTAVQYTRADRITNASWTPTSVWTVGGNVGLGMRFFFNKWITLHAEVRDIIYLEDEPVLTATPTALKNQLLFDVGLSFFFPIHFDEG